MYQNTSSKQVIFGTKRIYYPRDEEDLISITGRDLHRIAYIKRKKLSPQIQIVHPQK